MKTLGHLRLFKENLNVVLVSFLIMTLLCVTAHGKKEC